MPANPVLGYDPEFAGLMDALAAKALLDGDFELSAYLMDAADCWSPADEGTHVMRMAVLNAALGRQESRP